jgi:DNA polymerase
LFSLIPQGRLSVKQRGTSVPLERALVKPKLVVALGATAARSLSGKNLAIAKTRGHTLVLDDGTGLVVTFHPSALLRIKDSEDKARHYDELVADLRHCALLVAPPAQRS